MPATDTVMELGRLGGPDAACIGPRHRLLYLRERDMVVVPFARTTNGWNCVVAASRTLRPVDPLTLTDDEVDSASTTLAVVPGRDPDGYARLAWLSQAFRQWPGGATLALTRHIIDTLRSPKSLHIPAAALADYAAIARLLPTTRPVAVGRLIDHLLLAGLLTRASDELWRLTLPAPSQGVDAAVNTWAQGW